MDPSHDRRMDALDTDPVAGQTRPSQRGLQDCRRGQSIGVVVVHQGNLWASRQHPANAFADLLKEALFGYFMAQAWCE